MPAGHISASARRAHGPVPSGAVRRRAGYLLAIALTLGLSALAWTLAIAPVHGVHSAAACDTAYAEARSRTDSIAVDLLSYPDPTGHGLPRRCGFPRE